MEIRIDGTRCDIFRRKVSLPCFDPAQLTDPEAAREGSKVTVALPRTPRNDNILLDAADLHTGLKFNFAEHRAAIMHDGATLVEGVARLTEVTEKEYRLEIRTGGSRWATAAAQTLVGDTKIDFDFLLTPLDIERGWSDDSPVKFFPVTRDRYPDAHNPDDLKTTQQLLTIDDYHPFIHVGTLLRAIFSQAGYKAEGSFLTSPLFSSLYMSGAYPSRDTAAMVGRMGFKASRTADIATHATHMGMVYADGKRTANSVGNLVTTASPFDYDSDQRLKTGLFNNGGCFDIAHDDIVYTPPMEVTASFEYHIKYTTQHRILTRDRLKCIDRIFLGAGTDIRLQVANCYEDRRNSFRGNYQYRVMVFDHNPADTYELTTRAGENGTDHPWREFSGHTTVAVSPATQDTVAVLWCIRNGQRRRYEGDWALYDGFVEEFGQTTVEFKVNSSPEKISPAAPKEFFDIHFMGGDPDALFILHKETSLRVLFHAGPGFGSRLKFKDVACHPVRQIELLGALQQMFNLRFFTEEPTRTVIIEPRDLFYRTDSVTDWRGKTLADTPVRITDTALETHDRLLLGYLDSEGELRRHDRDSPLPFGSWETRSGTFASKMGRRSVRNPLFHPSITLDRQITSAPAAHLIAVGDRDSLSSDGINFAPLIVRYMGLCPLPPNQKWSADSRADHYPLAAFHFAGEGSTPPFTLCFEDRDNARGLHSFYDRQIADERFREQVTLTLRLTAEEVEALLLPRVSATSIRSLFRIDTPCGEILAHLTAIADFDPRHGTARCTFRRVMTDPPA